MSKQRIFFDGLPLIDGHFSGVGQYTLGILRGVDEILEKQKLSGMDAPQVAVIIPKDSVVKFLSFNFKHLEYRKYPVGFTNMSRMWHKNLMPPIDLLFGRGHYVFTRFVDMRILFSKSSIVVYDLSYEFFKQYSDEKNALFLSNGVKRSAKKASNVFTISENSKKEIHEFYKFPKKNIHIATPAADQKHFYRRSAREVKKVKTKYNLPEKYILALSNLEPRKNLETLIDAYCALPAKTRQDTSLLLVGVNGWKTERLFKKIIDLVEAGYNITRPNAYISDEDKPAVISGANALVYPSHYEGFGMPPLEALACGTPTITSDNSSLPEVVGDTGIMHNCNDTPSFTRSIQKVLNDKNIHKKVVANGPVQAEKFDWNTSAQTYLHAILGDKA